MCPPCWTLSLECLDVLTTCLFTTILNMDEEEEDVSQTVSTKAVFKQFNKKILCDIPVQILLSVIGKLSCNVSKYRGF